MSSNTCQKILNSLVYRFLTPSERLGMGFGLDCLMSRSENFITIDPNDFFQAVNQHLKVMVQFRTSWSGSCHLYEPIVKKLAVKYQQSVICYTINLEEGSKIKKDYGIYDYPTLIFFNKGQEIDRLIGLQPQNILETKIKHLIQHNQ